MPPKKAKSRDVDVPQIFGTLRFYFLSRAHMSLMMQRVVEHGAKLDATMVPGVTTHIIAPAKIYREQLDALPTATDQDPLLSPKYELVTQQWVAQCIIKKKLQNEANFRPVIVEPPAATPIQKRQKLEEEPIPQLTVTPPKQTNRPSSATREEKKEIVEKADNNNNNNNDNNGKHVPCVVRRQGSEWIAVQGTKPQFTGGNTGIPWGSYGVWEEPFDKQKAEEAVETLRKKYVDSDVDAVGLGDKSADKVKELLQTGQNQRTQAARTDERQTAYTLLMRVWGVGPTVAEKWYNLGCRTLEDVEKKVEEKELKLTIHQQCGMKHFEDFEIKIPREEISIVETLLREATFELVERLGASHPEKTYCYATGSYRRGQAESSDIDFLVILPESMPIQDCHHFLRLFLTKLLGMGFLIDEMGPREVSSGNGNGGNGDGSTASTHSSWMGVCRLSGALAGEQQFPYRRLDIKVYQHQHAACALNYFANSQSFCRATRNWARGAVAREAAKKLNPIATGFKISDLEMCPMITRRIVGQSKPETVPLEPAVQLTCETDLYEMIGLSYVPFTMRYFDGFK